MDKILEVNELAVSFDTYGGKVQAVRGVSFDLYKGETLAIVGESGSGKSVTSQSIIQLIPMPPGRFEKGSIIFNGEDLIQKSEIEMEKIRGKDIGVIFQDSMTSLNSTMKVGGQISEGLIKQQKLNKKSAYEKCIELLRLVGIPN
ncbi:MAG: ATP-binding cassette domain-containing protein, partial [Heyndrickxia sp.]